VTDQSPPGPTEVVAPVSAAPAGWYPVAPGSAQLRWWDGTQWTEHVHDPAAAFAPAGAGAAPAVPVVAPPLRAPEGTNPATAWFWLLAIGVPVLQLLDLIPASIFVSQLLSASGDASTLVNAEFSPSYLVLLLCGWFIYAVCIVFAALDWRELRQRDVPRPFHWAWSFFVLAVGWPAVYMIGRSVVVKRRTGRGMAPLWVFIGLQVVAFAAISVVTIVAIVQFLSVFGNGLSASGNVL
jgi:hypothetical protein